MVTDRERNLSKEINHGFIEPEIVESDFWLGSGKLGSIVLNEKGDWRPYLPVMEKQNMGFEPSACVSFGTLSALEMIHKLLWAVEPNYSDRFLAKMSDTNPYEGNSPKKVSNTIKDCGTVKEKEWPMTETLAEYYKDVPICIKDIGKIWRKHYGFGYEYADKSQLKEALRRSPVGVAVDAWNKNDKGEYIKLRGWNHWCVLVFIDEQEKNYVWDSYDENIKILEKGYDLGFPQIYTLKKREKVVMTEWQRFWGWIKEYVNELLR